MTDCANVEMRDRLPELVHGELDASTRAALIAHVDGCTACAHELALLRRAHAALRRAPQVDVGRIVAALPRPATAGRPGLTLVGAGPGQARGGWRARSWRPLAIAASLVIAAGVTAVGVRRVAAPDGKSATNVAVAPPHVAEVVEPPVAPLTAEPRTTPSGSSVALEPDPESTPASALLAVNVASMTDAQVEGLLAELDDLDASLAVEPRQLMTVPSPDGGAER